MSQFLVKFSWSLICVWRLAMSDFDNYNFSPENEFDQRERFSSSTGTICHILEPIAHTTHARHSCHIVHHGWSLCFLNHLEVFNELVDLGAALSYGSEHV